MSGNPGKIKSNKKTRYPATDYEKIFHPRTVAVIGVSAEEGGTGFGTGMLKSMTAMGYEGKIYPVNPKGGRISGMEIFRRVLRIVLRSRACRRNNPAEKGRIRQQHSRIRSR